jgi:L-rhamnose mutarotase
MQTLAIHTRLKADRIDDYERIHAVIPADLDTALREAGVSNWKIWRSGQDLFHWVQVEDVDAMRASLADAPADQRWQELIAPLLEPVTGGEELRLVWELP